MSKNLSKEPSESRKVQVSIEQQKHPAQWVFALFLTILSFFFLAHLSEQAKFPSNKAFVSQPGFWPALALAGMVFCSSGFLYNSWGKRDRRQKEAVLLELQAWFKVLEFPLWFLVYVWLVPMLGYLPSTLLFSMLMTWRLGYTQKSIYTAAILLSITIVVVFKSLLEVKIPGGEIYNYLPDNIRNFMMLRL